MAQKRRYTFSEKKKSRGGRLAVGLGIAAIVILVGDLFLSVLSEGEAPPFIGAVAIMGALLSAYGFSEGMASFAEKDTSAGYSIIGSILCGVTMIIYLALFLNGLK